MEFLADIQKQKWRKRNLGAPSLLVIHRCDFAKKDEEYPDVIAVPSSKATYKDALRRFLDIRPHREGSYTGGIFPYTFVIETGGRVVQLAPMDAATPHSLHWNDKGLSIMCVGDFRKFPAPPEQWSSLVDLCASLSSEGYAKNGIHGHSDLPAGSKDENKICPGRFLSIVGLRAAIISVKSIDIPIVLA